jgi:hypothetical protein
MRARPFALGLALVTAFCVAGPASPVVAASSGDKADLLLGSYLGGHRDECHDLGSDCSTALALGPDGSIYVVGATESTNFPVTPGAYDTVGGTAQCPVGPNCTDAFVARIDPKGSRLIYATYLGGSGTDCQLGCAVAVDSAGAAYVTGGTESTDFPTTFGAPDRTCGSDGRCNGGGQDGFVSKSSPDGSPLEYSTYLGGAAVDWGRSIALGPRGAAYVGGATYSDDFPVTPGALDTSFNGGYVDAFVTKIAPNGRSFAFSTFVGGTLGDLGVDVALSADADTIYEVGYTNSYDFPTSPTAYDRTTNGEYEAYLIALDRTGSTLELATYLGGNGVECYLGCAVAITPAGDPIVAGATESSDFPVTDGALDTTFGGGSWCPCDGFVTEFDPTASHLVYSTFVGGSGADFVHDAAIDAAGGAVVVAETDSTDMPATAGAYRRHFGGGYSDAFAAALAPDGSRLDYGTYLGGAGSDCLSDCGVAVAAGGLAYVAGDNRAGGFPTTRGAFQPKRGGRIDAFVAVLNTAPG